MKKIIILLLLLFLLLPLNLARADSLAISLKGRILLQVEANGEAWYVHPTTAERYYMANGDDAYDIMRNFGVGITNANLEKIKNSKNLAIKQKRFYRSVFVL